LGNFYSRYPSNYLDTYFRKFSNEYISLETFLPLITDQAQFLLLRNKILVQPSIPERQQIVHTETLNTLKSEQRLHLHYTHEQRFDSLKRDIHQIYSDIFQNTDASKYD